MTHRERAERRRAIAEYVRQTKCTGKEAAKAFGVTHQTVYIACREHGAQTKRPQLPKEAAALRRQKIAEHIRANNCTVAEAAKAFGVSYYAAYVACHEHGVKLADKLQPSTLKIVADLFDSALTIADIATQYGITSQHVSQIFVKALKAGIPIPRPTKSPELASRNGTRAEVTA